jgi:NAD(P)H-hydrate epimerase
LNGKVLLVAGSKDMPGAAVLCARAVYRAGAGFVTVAAPATVYNALVAALPEALILKIEEADYLSAPSLKYILNYLKKTPHDVLLTGPGLGKGAEITLNLLNKTKLPAVIDADSLNYLAKAGADKLDKNTLYILTPHQGEMKKLLNKKVIKENCAAKELSKLSGATALLKGPGTKIFHNGKTFINTTGNEGLAKAGSGDILSGIIAGIFAQLVKKYPSAKDNALKAALLGVYLHGKAADEAIKKTAKTSLLATDVLNYVPDTLRKI